MQSYGTPTVKFSLAVLLAALTVTGTVAAHAGGAPKDITCTASNTTVNFGAYDVLSGNPVDGVGSFTVTCVSSNANFASLTYTAKLPPPSIVRELAPPSGSDRLTYKYYVDSARTVEWGDGSTGGTSAISGTMTVVKNATVTSGLHTFYARIFPGGQDVSAAAPTSPTTYTQTLTVTVTCTGSSDC